jgi:peptidoglycan/LPS O-acetylase OafA/YrhL
MRTSTSLGTLTGAAEVPRGNNLDFLRFALASAVILSHSYALLVGSDVTEPPYEATRGQVTLGGLAVNFFFVISGSLVTHSWLQSRGLFDYLKKRALRIYPAFIVVTLLGALVVGPISAKDPAETMHGINAKDLLIGCFNLLSYEPQGAFPDNPFKGAVNGSLWSIQFEFWCYIGVAALGVTRLLDRCGLIAGLFVVSILVSVIVLVFDLHPGGKILGKIFGYPVFWARLLPVYLSGMVLYLYREHIPLSHVFAAGCVTDRR